ncbi:zinc-finger homeodomain protein 6-like [Musa acuminata AAA Group]|uniref:zinc-finger homeodomain protein 6-like n=1 Tax=Musa acuminata AAA Group TaxID=214697 RepID=UPI0031D111BA
MEFRNPNEVGMPSSPSGYNSSLIRGGSAFSKPTLSPTSSLLSPRVGGGGLGGGGGGGGGGARNGNILGSTRSPPSPPTLEPTTTMDPSPQSLTKNTGQAFVSNSSTGAAGAGVPSKTEPAAITSKNSTTTTTADIFTRYRECLRNHAAAIGGHVVDGCGEFMPSGYPDTAEALNCAACGCHRSFHRREVDGGTNAAGSYYHATDHLPVLLPPPHPLAHPHHHHHHHQKPFQLGGFSSPSPTVPGSSGFFQFGSNRPSGSGGTTTESSSEERINAAAPTAATMPRKRFRTKFTAEQKNKMLAFAERIGWTIQRQDSEMIEQFCAEIGVRRQVLKVWMHNNKHTIIRKQPPPQHQQEPPVQQQHQQPPESRLPYSSCSQDQTLI